MRLSKKKKERLQEKQSRLDEMISPLKDNFKIEASMDAIKVFGRGMGVLISMDKLRALDDLVGDKYRVYVSHEDFKPVFYLIEKK